MASSGSGYDLSSSTFSPDGRIFQVEYAAKAVENAGTAIGIKCSDGVVLGVSKPLLHKLLVPHTSGKRIHSVAPHAGIAMTGFVPDGRQVVGRARDEARQYVETYGEPMAPHVLGQRMSMYVHYFTLHGSLRPFGACTLLAGFDKEVSEYTLSMVEPSGVVYDYYACAAGKGRQPARTELEKLNIHKEPPTCQEAVKQLARILYMLYDETKDKPFELELSWICQASQNKHVGVPQDYVKEAVAWAKAEVEKEESDDEEEEEEAMEE